jgi:hypothetical protein
MSERDCKYDTFKLGTFGAIVLVIALPVIFIVAIIGSAISMLFTKNS